MKLSATGMSFGARTKFKRPSGEKILHVKPNGTLINLDGGKKPQIKKATIPVLNNPFAKTGGLASVAKEASFVIGG